MGVVLVMHVPDTTRMDPSFFGPHKRIHHAVCVPKLPNFLLHGFFEERLLVVDQSPLLFVVVDARLIAPVPAPPVTPCQLSGCTLVLSSIISFLPKGGPFRLSPQRTAALSDHCEETAATQNTGDDLDNDDIGGFG